MRLAGFWAHLERDVEAGRSELRLLLDHDGASGREFVSVAVFFGGTVEEGVQQAIDTSVAHYRAMGVPASTIRWQERGSEGIVPAIGALVAHSADDGHSDRRIVASSIGIVAGVGAKRRGLFLLSGWEPSPFGVRGPSS